MFVRSLAPSVSGWYALDIFRFTLVSLCKAFQNWDTKSLSRLETMSSGRPFSQYHSLKKICASSSAVSVVFVGTMRMSEPDLSVHIMSQKMDDKHVKAQVQKCHVPRKSPHGPIS